MMGYLKRVSRSLSVKLIGVFLLAVLALVWMLWVALDITFERQFSDTISPYFSKYLSSLQSEVGFPPDIAVAKRITDTAQVNIVIEAPTYSWSSNNDFIDKAYLNVQLQEVGDSGLLSEVGFYKGNFILRTYKPGYIISFVITEKFNTAPRLDEIATVFIATALILAVLYWVTYQLFKPIRNIERGVRRIGGGDVSHRLNIQRSDELGALAFSVNKMADNIEGMLEAKRQLLLAISHELRTPITRSKIALSLMGDSHSKASLSEDMDEMESLIHELLESEKLRENHAPLDKNHVNINEIIYQVQGRFFEKSPLVLSLDESLPNIDVDAGRIGLAIKNLIKNALTASQNADDKVIVTTVQESRMLLITVSDSGIGIDADKIPHLTEPFYRTDESRQRKTGGFGIGLYLIKAIIDAHHGELLIDSHRNHGTSVTIRLPIERVTEV